MVQLWPNLITFSYLGRAGVGDIAVYPKILAAKRGTERINHKLLFSSFRVNNYHLKKVCSGLQVCVSNKHLVILFQVLRWNRLYTAIN